MLGPREPPLGRRALDGVRQPGGGTLRCLFLKLFGPKWRRESNQMTSIKKSFTFPSPFENSFRVSSHCPVPPHFQMCDQKRDCPVPVAGPLGAYITCFSVLFSIPFSQNPAEAQCRSSFNNLSP